ncbi:hypothetical protein KNU71_gp042 [Streptomyces phage Braelyn]|jgi:hypothetical protein|uniref:Uncharacterized protein n=1 Tax=Streptomyces phage Braelyn TaxID=2593356 RepID=A0A514U284_9CAUD|nr:hypothetical protein KNU71_gp015 [Streptomyces phage Braelyn]YP_010104114.1 hypothetical protein KNU71_gp042 [Streptomyces phage Braelyn]WNM72897.1 hypothetical protein SEA_PERSIMMON_14 [Streptomyces phage Persimmon]QDK02873.1 hypothetical protein SEA_BRAELYN_15 [Streptomyces phage Braelyn]QDK03074.1 hypothetical protein SEA_BRAELYN_260 [Streptomyces phage Braelyn]WNM73107.1 hypothetical protein SEA_PERSIMMON_265 [Streptomyces phage Persimmon]
MAVTLAKKTDANHNIVSSVTISEGFKVKGSKSVYSIRLETWKTTPGSDSTEVRIVIRDQDGKFHGATNFKQNIMLDFTALMNGNHSNRRAKAKK